MEAAQTLFGRQAFKQILDAESPLVVLGTADAERLVEQFRLLARRSGQAVYLWRQGEGLRSLREGGVVVPGCLRLADTLRYVMQSLHFGIYLIDGVDADMIDPHRTLLRQLVRARAGHVRRLVLMGTDASLAEGLEDAVAVVEPEHVPLRLRDGRWVV